MKLNIQLFASNSASNSGLRSSGGNKGTVSVSFYEKELSDTNKKNNTTTIVASASFKQDTGAYASISSPMLYLRWYDSKSGQLVQKASQNVTAMNRYDVVTVSAEFDVVHRDDGTLEGYAQGEWNYSGGSAYVCKTGSATTALTTLTKVPRASGCWASDTNIGSTATINIEKASDTFTHTIKWASEGLSGTIATKTSANSLPFAIPTSLYAKIPNSTYATITLTIDTYDGDTLIGTRNDSTFKAIAFKDDNKPIINTNSMQVTDDNQESVAITKDNTVFIKGISKIRVVGGISAQNSATLTSTKITNGGQTIDGYYGSNGELATTFPKAITSNVIEFNVVDSREYDNSATYTIPSNKFLDYDAPKINANFIRNTATDGKVNVELSAGSYFVGTIGGVANSLTLKYRYKKKGTTTWSNPITITFDKNTSTGLVPQQTILLNETFNYRDSFEFELQYTDILGTYSIKDSISAGIPGHWWNKEKFVINGELHLAGADGTNEYNIEDKFITVRNEKTDSDIDVYSCNYINDKEVVLFDGVLMGGTPLNIDMTPYKRLLITFIAYNGTDDNTGGSNNTMIMDLTTTNSRMTKYVAGMVVPYCAGSDHLEGTMWCQAKVDSAKTTFSAYVGFGTTGYAGSDMYCVTKIVGVK